MLNFFSLRYHCRRRCWLYPLLSITFALVSILTIPQMGRAGDWLDLIFRGIQIVQLSNLSDQQEVELGQQINQQLVGNEVRLYRNRDVNQ